MAKKLMSFMTKGMNRDLSVSKFNPEFAFENKNLRLSTNEGNTLMSWVNEKGTALIPLVNTGSWDEVHTSRKLINAIHGTPIGTAVINNQLVLFTHETVLEEEPSSQRRSSSRSIAPSELVYSYDDNTHTASVIYDSSYTGDIIIPETVMHNEQEYTVTSIDRDAFRNCNNVISIYIPDTVVSIGNSAFWECTRLKSINIPHTVTSIGGGAFYDCECLREITIDHNIGLRIEYGTFNRCHFAVDNFNVYSDNYIINEDTNPPTLYATETEDGLLINGSTIVKCRADVASVTIPDFITNIDSSVSNIGLQNITLNSNKFASDTPVNLNTVFGNAVENYIINNSDVSLENISFSGYNNLVTIISEIPPKIDNDTFNVGDDLIISIPSNTTSDYEDAHYPLDNLMERPYSINPDTCDHIYLLKYTNEEKTGIKGIELFKGKLDFEIAHPIETRTSYESLDIQKVYWLDGINQLRFINIADLDRSYYTATSSINSSFDCIPELALKEDISVSKLFNSAGEFPAGVIQYAFTYYNLHGQESNIFYTTPLQYISHRDRGGAPDEKIANAFKLQLKNLDTKFDYLRIYSIVRTSLDATPIVKRVQDIKISDLPTEIGGTYIGDLDDVDKYLYSVGTENGTESIIPSIDIRNALLSNSESPTDATFLNIDDFIASITDLEIEGNTIPRSTIIGETRYDIPLINDGQHTENDQYPSDNLPETMTLSEEWKNLKYEDDLDKLDKAEENQTPGGSAPTPPEDVYTVLDFGHYPNCYIVNGADPGTYYFTNKNPETGENFYTLSGNLEIPESINVGGINRDVVGIDDNALKDCTGITKIRLSNNITDIKQGAFWGCTGLTEINLPDTISTIKGNVFEDCTSLTNITIPSSVTTIEAGAFQNSGLTSIAIPSTVVNINSTTTGSTLERVTYGAFLGCQNLTSVIIEGPSDSQTNIGEYAFIHCENIKTLEYNCQTLGNWFADSKNSLQTVVLGENVSSITDNSIFTNCPKLSDVTIKNNGLSISSLSFGDSPIISLNIDNSIGDDVFGNDNKLPYLKHLVLGDHVGTIGKRAFQECGNLEDVEIGSGISSIGNAAFDNCTTLRSLAIYSSSAPTVNNDEDPFSNTGINEVIILDSATGFSTGYWDTFSDKYNVVLGRKYNIDGIYYTLISNGTPTVYEALVTAGPLRDGDYTDEPSKPWYEGDIIIPEKVIYNDIEYNVTGIEEDTFKDCANLTSIALPSGIDALGIEANAFENCSSLTKVTLSNSNFLSTNKASDASLSTIFGTQVETYDINSIGNDNVPVVRIGDYTFNGCANLKSFVIPKTIVTIGEGAFKDCTNLGTGSLGIIESNALLIRNSVTTISSNAFENCTGLSSIVIGKNVNSIGNDAFKDCSGLIELIARMPYSYGIRNTNNRIFENINSHCILRVDPNYIENYKGNGWDTSVFKKVEGLEDPRFDEGVEYYYIFKEEYFPNLIIKFGDFYYTWKEKSEDENSESRNLKWYFFPRKSEFTDNTSGSEYAGNFMVCEQTVDTETTRYNVRAFKKSTPVEKYRYDKVGYKVTPYKLSDTYTTEYNGELSLSADGKKYLSLQEFGGYIEGESSTEYRFVLSTRDYDIYVRDASYGGVGSHYYLWEKDSSNNGVNDKTLYLKYIGSDGTKYYQVPNESLDEQEKLKLYIFPHGFYTYDGNDYVLHSETIVALQLGNDGSGYQDQSLLEVNLVYEDTQSASFIDTNTTGETVDPTHLLYLGGESVVAQTMEDKDGTLFLGNLRLSRPQISQEIKTEIQSFSGLLVKENGVYVKTDNYPLANDDSIRSVRNTRHYILEKGRYAHTLSAPEGEEYQGASAFKANEFYRLGVQFQYKSGRWSEPCWIGDKQWTCQNDRNGDYGPWIDEGGGNPECLGAGIAGLPEFEYAMPYSVQASLYDLGYRRMRAVYAVPKPNDRSIICQGVANPTMYRNCDRNRGIYAQSSWLFRTKFTPSSNYGYREGLGGYVEYSGILPSIWREGYAIGPTHNEVYYADYVNGSLVSYYPYYDSFNGVWMPFYHSTEVMGDYNDDEIFKIDNDFITLNSPDIEFDSSIINSDLTGSHLYLTGYAELSITYGDIDIQTSTPTIGSGGRGFIHQPMTLSGTSALISGNFYEDHLVWAEKDDDDGGKIVYKFMRDEDDADGGPVLWPICMWHRKGSLNNDVNRENASSKLLKKKISNFRYANPTYYNQSSSARSNGTTDVSYGDIQVFNNSEAAQIIKVGGETYQGCVDMMVTPSNPSFFYFVGEPLKNKIAGWKPNFNDLPICKYFQSDIYDIKNNDWIYILQDVNHDFASIDPHTYPEKKNGLFYDDSNNYKCLRYPWGGTVVNEAYKWLSMGNNYDDAGKSSAGIAYFRDGIPIKYKSAPHIVISGLGSTGYYLPNVFKKDGAMPVYEVCRVLDKYTRFGGTSEDALQEATWIPCGPVMDINPNAVTIVPFKWGDTYFQRYECLKTYAYTPEDLNQVVEIGSFVLETRVNIDGRYDRNRAQISNLNANPQNFNLINPVYSQQDNFFNYKILPEEYYKETTYPNQITWTLTKESGADVDKWTNITLASILEMDGSVGEINKLIRFNDQLIAFQDKGVAQILYNENTQISTTEGVPIEIANSGKVQGKRYFTNTIGCSNKWSIARTASGIYFMDSNGKSVYLFNGELNNVSTTMGFNSWAKAAIPSASSKWNPIDFDNFVAYHDRLNQDVLFINDNEALAFSEKFKVFTSFYDYGSTPYFCNFEDTGLWIDKDSNLWKQNAGEYCKFFGNNKPYWMTLIGNPEPQTDKIFTNLEFRASVVDDGEYDGVTGKFTATLPFDSLEAWNEYQHGYTELKNLTGSTAMQHPNEGDSSLKRKFRMWRCDIPRNNYPWYDYPVKEEGETDAHYQERVTAYNEWYKGETEKGISRHIRKPMDRMRNPWVYLKLKKDAEQNIQKSLPKTETHDLIMTYYN